MTAAAVGLTALAVLALAVVVLRRRLMVVTVTGGSMAPTLAHGDVLLVCRRRTVRVADLVVLADPAGGRWFVKRAVAVPGDPVPPGVPAREAVVPPAALVVLGDHPGSLDSRRWGLVPAERVGGVVLVRLRRGPAVPEDADPGPDEGGRSSWFLSRHAA